MNSTNAVPAKKTAKRGPIPHHRVDRTLYERAHEKAEKAGWSMSQVAGWGLDRYLEDLTDEEWFALLDRAKHRPKEQVLPADVTRRLQRMRSERDGNEILSAYLSALFEVGWSAGVLAKALGITRQATYGRIRGFADKESGQFNLPEVPFPEVIPPSPRRHIPEGGREPVDWAIWVERDAHMVASQRAMEDGGTMWEVMEGTLRDFLAADI